MAFICYFFEIIVAIYSFLIERDENTACSFLHSLELYMLRVIVIDKLAFFPSNLLHTWLVWKQAGRECSALKETWQACFCASKVKLFGKLLCSIYFWSNLIKLVQFKARSLVGSTVGLPFIFGYRKHMRTLVLGPTKNHHHHNHHIL